MGTMAVRLLPKPKTVNPRSLTPEERAWLAVWGPAAQEALLDGLAGKLGLRRAISWGMLNYLEGRAEGYPAAIVSDRTKATYRKHLRALGAAGVTPPPANLASVASGARRRNGATPS